jgi:hypothetical protein
MFLFVLGLAMLINLSCKEDGTIKRRSGSPRSVIAKCNEKKGEQCSIMELPLIKVCLPPLEFIISAGNEGSGTGSATGVALGTFGGNAGTKGGTSRDTLGGMAGACVVILDSGDVGFGGRGGRTKD